MKEPRLHSPRTSPQLQECLHQPAKMESGNGAQPTNGGSQYSEKQENNVAEAESQDIEPDVKLSSPDAARAVSQVRRTVLELGVEGELSDAVFARVGQDGQVRALVLWNYHSLGPGDLWRTWPISPPTLSGDAVLVFWKCWLPPATR